MIKFKWTTTMAAAALSLAPAHALAQAAASKPISMGLQLTQVPEKPEVIKVLPGRTAAALGFKVGDILLEAGGQTISPEVARAYLQDKKEGDQLSFKVKRGEALIELTGKGVAAPETAEPTTAQPQE